jgi:hypothetical protein
MKTKCLAKRAIVSLLKATANLTWEWPFVYWLDVLDSTRV